MRYDLFANRKDELILLARILLMVLFVKFGLDKLTGFTATVVVVGVAAMSTILLVQTVLGWFGFG